MLLLTSTLILLLEVYALFPIIECFSIAVKSIHRKRHAISTFSSVCNPLKSRYFMDDDIISKKDNLSANFDIFSAVTLAGYAFEAYNYPKTGKVAHGADGTAIIFTSTEYIRKCFQGVLLLTVIKGNLSKDVNEEEFLEKVLSGENPDPYVVISVSDADVCNQRIFDEMKTEVIQNTREPIWMARSMLYIQNKPKSSSIEIALYDKDFLKSDDLIGTGSMTLSNLLHDAKPNTKSSINKHSNVSVPIFKELPDMLNSFIWKKAVTRKHQIGTVVLNADYIPFDTPNSDAEILLTDSEREESNKSTDDNKNRLPVGASPEVNWRDLLSEIMHLSNAKHELGWSLRSGDLHQLCSVENKNTDTQASIWADFKERKIIVSFRGTETAKFKDFLVDVQIFQVPYMDGIDVFNGAQVHQGFLQAYKSVEDAILQQLSFVFKAIDGKSDGSQEDPWRFFITGHSLGGALATLFAADLGRIKAGHVAEDRVDFAAKYWNDNVFASSMRAATITCYTFGTPRVGNTRFKEAFNSLVPHCHRVVNQMDIVARMPRSSKASIILDYEHVGNTVLIDDAATDKWIADADLDACPLNEISLFNSGELQDMQAKMNETITTLAQTSTSAAVSAMYDSIQQQMGSLVDFTASALKGGGNSSLRLDQSLPIVDFANLNISLPSLNVYVTEFIQQELRLWDTIRDGSALSHHLEPSYYLALANAINNNSTRTV